MKALLGSAFLFFSLLQAQAAIPDVTYSCELSVKESVVVGYVEYKNPQGLRFDITEIPPALITKQDIVNPEVFNGSFKGMGAMSMGDKVMFHTTYTHPAEKFTLTTKDCLVNPYSTDMCILTVIDNKGVKKNNALLASVDPLDRTYRADTNDFKGIVTAYYEFNNDLMKITVAVDRMNRGPKEMYHGSGKIVIDQPLKNFEIEGLTQTGFHKTQFGAFSMKYDGALLKCKRQ